ncbi:MAG: hypothetical protein AAF231_05695 [Pseudomonadota bacterium]
MKNNENTNERQVDRPSAPILARDFVESGTESPSIPRFTALSLLKKRAQPADLRKSAALGSNFSCAVENSDARSGPQTLKNKRFSAKNKKMPEWRKKGLRVCGSIRKYAFTDDAQRAAGTPNGPNANADDNAADKKIERHMRPGASKVTDASS